MGSSGRIVEHDYSRWQECVSASNDTNMEMSAKCKAETRVRNEHTITAEMIVNSSSGGKHSPELLGN